MTHWSSPATRSSTAGPRRTATPTRRRRSPSSSWPASAATARLRPTSSPAGATTTVPGSIANIPVAAKGTSAQGNAAPAGGTGTAQPGGASGSTALAGQTPSGCRRQQERRRGPDRHRDGRQRRSGAAGGGCQLRAGLGPDRVPGRRSCRRGWQSSGSCWPWAATASPAGGTSYGHAPCAAARAPEHDRKWRPPEGRARARSARVCARVSGRLKLPIPRASSSIGRAADF